MAEKPKKMAPPIMRARSEGAAPHLDEPATKMQAAYRGHTVRKELKRKKEWKSTTEANKAELYYQSEMIAKTRELDAKKEMAEEVAATATHKAQREKVLRQKYSKEIRNLRTQNEDLINEVNNLRHLLDETESRAPGVSKGGVDIRAKAAAANESGALRKLKKKLKMAEITAQQATEDAEEQRKRVDAALGAVREKDKQIKTQGLQMRAAAQRIRKLEERVRELEDASELDKVRARLAEMEEENARLKAQMEEERVRYRTWSRIKNTALIMVTQKLREATMRDITDKSERAALEAMREDYENQIKALRDALETSTKDLAKFVNLVKQQQQQMATIKSAMEAKDLELAKALQRMREVEKQAASNKRSFTFMSLAYTAKLSGLMKELRDAKAKIEALGTENEALHVTIEKQDAENKQIIADLREELGASSARAAARVSKLERDKLRLQDEARRMQREVEEREATVKSQGKLLAQLREQLRVTKEFLHQSQMREKQTQADLHSALERLKISEVRRTELERRFGSLAAPSSSVHATIATISTAVKTGRPTTLPNRIAMSATKVPSSPIRTGITRGTRSTGSLHGSVHGGESITLPRDLPGGGTGTAGTSRFLGGDLSVIRKVAWHRKLDRAKGMLNSHEESVFDHEHIHVLAIGGPSDTGAVSISKGLVPRRFKVSVTPSLDSALTFLTSTQPGSIVDVIVVDYHLPTGDATGLLRTINTTASIGQKPPTIVLFDSANPGAETQCRFLGAIATLVKPVTPEQLMSNIRLTMLDGRKLMERSRTTAAMARSTTHLPNLQ